MKDVIQSRCIKASLRGNFFRKTTKISHSSILFNNIPVLRTSTLKHLGVYLDEKLDFSTRIREKIGKAIKGTGVIKKL